MPRNHDFGILAAIILSLLVGPTGLAGRVNMDRAAHCRTMMRIAANKFGVRAEHTPTVEELKPGTWILSESRGLMRFDGLSDRGVVVHLPGHLPNEKSTLPDGIPGEFAPLGTAKARQIAERRLDAHFKRPELIQLYCAYRGLSAMVKPDREDGEPVRARMRSMWERVRQNYPLLKDASLEEFPHAMLWSLEMLGPTTLFAPGAIPRPAGEQPTIDGMGPYRDEIRKAASEFLDLYYNQTGDDLVLSGLLSTEVKARSTGKIFISGRASDSKQIREPREDLDNIPLDVWVSLANHIWTDRRRQLEKISHGTTWLARLDSEDREDVHTQLLRAYRDNGNISVIENILDRGRTYPGFQAWLKQVTAEPDSKVIIPVPSSSSLHANTTAPLAKWLQPLIPSAELAPENIQHAGNRSPRPLRGGVASRIDELQSRAYRVRDVKNKVVILVDDNITSGGTTTLLTHQLYEAGAKAVFVFSLSRTNVSPFDLSATAVRDTRGTFEPVEFNPVKPLSADFNLLQNPSWMNDLVEANVRPPWETKTIAKMSAEEKLARKQWIGAFTNKNMKFLVQLSEKTLSSYSAGGAPTREEEKSLWHELKQDEFKLQAYALSLQSAYPDGVPEEAQKLPLVKHILDLARGKLETAPHFEKQIPKPLAAWLREGT